MLDRIPCQHFVGACGIAQLQPALFANRKGQGRAEHQGFAVIVGKAAVAFAVLQVQAKRDIAAQQIGLHETDAIAFRIFRRREGQTKCLATAQKVALGKADREAKAVIDRIGATKVQRAGWFLFDIHIDHHLIRTRPLAGVHIGGGKEIKHADAFCRVSDFARVEGVAFGNLELSAQDAVQRGCVALNIDPLHEHARATAEDQFHIQRQVAVVADHARLNPQEINTVPLALHLKAGHLGLDQGWGIDNTGAHLDDVLIDVHVNLRQIAGNRYFAKLELLTFLNIEHEEKAVTLFGQFGIGTQGAEIDIAARRIKVPQHLFVEFDPVFDQGIAADQCAKQARLFGLQHATQTPVRIDPVSDKAQPLNLDHVAFENLKDEVNAVVAAPDDARVDPGRDATLGVIGFGDGARVAIRLCGIKDAPLLALHDGAERFVIQPPVAFKGHPVQRGQFHNRDQKARPLRLDLHAFEQAAGLQVLQSVVHLPRTDRLARSDSSAGDDRGVADTRISLDCNRRKSELLGPGRGALPHPSH
mmetsp:Transcript_18249/g.28808  ORF Transcript_18249/g.28808 Transcript_18249/m.28808 type:complete len:530 (+) Transcript_18249:3065-4654(+)